MEYVEGEVWLPLGKPDVAEGFLKKSYDAHLAAGGPAGSDTQRAVRMLVKACEAAGMAEEAKAWRGRLG